MKLALIDYGSGNLKSAAKSLEAAAAIAGLDMTLHVTSDPQRIASADRIVLPGVGAFGDCRAGLMAIDGLWQSLDRAVRETTIPFLGICVGMQLMADTGREHGRHDGFGWIGGEVRAIEPGVANLKIPHMGWNNLNIVQSHQVLEQITPGTDVYFVHSYHFVLKEPADCLATCHYGTEITAVIARENMIGTQFHPEKSQSAGLRFLANFLRWRP